MDLASGAVGLAKGIKDQLLDRLEEKERKAKQGWGPLVGMDQALRESRNAGENLRKFVPARASLGSPRRENWRQE